jgi:hypothetical protein
MSELQAEDESDDEHDDIDDVAIMELSVSAAALS